MTLPFNLEARLAKVGLSNQPPESQPFNNGLLHRHIIHFDYPSAQLLSQGEEHGLHLDIPKDVANQTPPFPRQNQPADFNTSFFSVVQVDPRPCSPILDPFDHTSVIKAIKTLQCDQRYTKSSVVRVTSTGSSDDIRTKIRIDSCFDSDLSKLEEFELDKYQWTQLMSRSRDLEWIKVLEDLVYRASDRAFYHVQDAVANISVSGAFWSTEELISTLWDSDPPRTAKQLLGLRMDDIWRYETIDFSHVRQNEYESAEVWLPCGCLDSINLEDWRQYTDETALEETCHTYGDRILRAEDDAELTIGEQRALLLAWFQADQSWKDLDNADFSLRTQVLHIKAGTLYHVLDTAFNSMKTVDLLSPASMAFANLPETRVGLEALEKFLYGSDQILQGTPMRILDGLLQKTQQAVVDPTNNITLQQITTLPGFWDSLKILLSRTMSFWIRRSCRKIDGQHHKFHLHDGVAFFSLLSWEPSARNDALLENPNDSGVDLEGEEGNVDAVDALVSSMKME